MIARSVWFSLFVVILAVGSSQCLAGEPPQSLVDQLGQAERVLIGIPEKDTIAAGGEVFRVEIARILRGNGKKGVLVSIVNSGDAEKFPKYQADKQYIFLLKKNPERKKTGGGGFVNLSTLELPLSDDKIVVSPDGKPDQEISLDDFEELIARTAPKTVDDSARTTPAGRWVFIASQEGVDTPMCLMEFTKSDKQPPFGARIVAVSKIVHSSTLKTAEADDTNVHLVFTANGDKFDFRGRLRNGTIYGDVAASELGLVQARLIPTEATTMANFQEQQRSAGAEEFIDAMNLDDPRPALGRFVRRFPDSPLAVDVYRLLVGMAAREHEERPALERLAKGLVEAGMGWGDRLGMGSQIDVSRILTRNEHLPELALEYQAAAQEKFTDDSPISWKLALGIDHGKCLVLTGKMEEGIAVWKKLRETRPFEPELVWLLARQLEKSGKIDEALPLVAQIVALPLMEPMVVESMTTGKRRPPREQRPSGVFERLWKEKHGNTSGLSAYLNESVSSTIRSIAGDRRAPRTSSSGARVVLCELFTGASCDPCSGADVLTSALEAAYAQSEVIVLRYHLHSPRPDPLANEETNRRFELYDERGTPQLFLDGRQFDAPGGFMPQVTGNFQRLLEEVEPALLERTDVKLDLSARYNQGKIAISAKAHGPKTFSADLRLRVVLAEDHVEYRAPNGINSHEMLVRAMPAGVDGVAPTKGKLEFSGEVDLERLRTKLARHLKRIETDTSADMPEKPLDFKAFHLVAFVQDGDDGEVLQAAAIPVSGMPAGGPKAAATKKGAERPAATSGGS